MYFEAWGRAEIQRSDCGVIVRDTHVRRRFIVGYILKRSRHDLGTRPSGVWLSARAIGIARVRSASRRGAGVRMDRDGHTDASTWLLLRVVQ